MEDHHFWLFFREKFFAAHDIIGQDMRQGMSFYVTKDPIQITAPITGELLWAYDCRIVSQIAEDMKVGDLMMGKTTFRISATVGEYDAPISG